MAKIEKLAIQTATVTCRNSTCKAVFTASIEEFIPQGGRYDNENQYHEDYIVGCPNCKTRCWIEDPKFDIRYITPAQMKKENRMAMATKIRRVTVSFFKEIGHLFDRILGLD